MGFSVHLSEDVWKELERAADSFNEHLEEIKEPEGLKGDLAERAIRTDGGENPFFNAKGLDSFDCKKYEIFSKTFLNPVRVVLDNLIKQRDGFLGKVQGNIRRIVSPFVPRKDYQKNALLGAGTIALAIFGIGALLASTKLDADKALYKVEDFFEKLLPPIKEGVCKVANKVKVLVEPVLETFEELFSFTKKAIARAFFFGSDYNDPDLKEIPGTLDTFIEIIKGFGEAFNPIEEIYVPSSWNSSKGSIDLTYDHTSLLKLEGTQMATRFFEMTATIYNNKLNIDDPESLSLLYDDMAKYGFIPPQKEDGESDYAYQMRLQEALMANLEKVNPMNPNSAIHYFTVKDGRWTQKVEDFHSTKGYVEKKEVVWDGVLSVYMRKTGGKWELKDEHSVPGDTPPSVVISKIEHSREEAEMSARMRANMLSLQEDMLGRATTGTGFSELSERTMDLTTISQILKKLDELSSASFFYNIFRDIHAEFATVSNTLFDAALLSMTGLTRDEYNIRENYTRMTKTVKEGGEKMLGRYRLESLSRQNADPLFFERTSHVRTEAMERLTTKETDFMLSLSESVESLKEKRKKIVITKVEKTEEKKEPTPLVAFLPEEHHIKAKEDIYVDRRVRRRAV